MDTILLVDDDYSIIETMSLILRQNGFNVLNAEKESTLFNILKNSLIDLIILDIQLPDRDGIEILKDLKENPDFSHIPVIMFTAHHNEKILQKAFEYGANDFIKKPISSKIELLARIKSHITIKKYEDNLRKMNLEKQIETLKQITTTIRHNLGQPLTVMSSYCSILERELKLDPDVYSRVTPVLKKIEKAIEEINNIIGQLKDITELEITSYVESIKMLKLNTTKKAPNNRG